MRIAVLLVVASPLAILACSGTDTVSPGSPDGGSLIPPPPADAAPIDAGGHDSPAVDAGHDVGTDVGVEAGPEAALPDTSLPDVAEAGPPTQGLNVSQNATDMYEAEQQIAVAPDGTIGIAWQAFSNVSPFITLAYRFSTDGGTTFSPIGRLTLPPSLSAGDPAITTDATGNFYISTLGIHFTGQNVDYTRVFVAKVPHGTTTAGTPVEATDPTTSVFHDHPKILVTASGAIVLAFMESQTETASTTTGIAAKSTDGGQTWTRSIIEQPPAIQFANLFWLCEGQGILYTTYLEATMTNYYVALRSSADDGTTWSTTSTVVSLTTEQPAGLDPGCMANGNDVWIGYGTTPNPGSGSNSLDSASAIRVAHSADRGATVGATPMDALDTQASMLGLLPSYVREASGALDVAYLAGNADGDTNGTMRYVHAASTAFGPSVEVDGPLLFTLNRTTRTWVGDYLGAAAHGGTLYTAYPMNATGATHIYFRGMPLP